jgi:hypothetical protein
LGNFWRALELKMLVHFLSFGIFYDHLVYYMGIWYIIWAFGILYGHLVYYMGIWYILLHFCHLMVIWYIFPFQEKYGNHICSVLGSCQW